MKINRAVFFFICALVGVSSRFAIGQVLDGPIVNPANGYDYYLLSSSDWTDAESTAQSMGGNLATIENAAENNWVLDTFGDYGDVNRYLLIGLYDPSQDQDGGSHASNFAWVDGSPVTYTNWNAGEPNNANGAEYWVEMYPNDVAGSADAPAGTPGMWNDIPDVDNPYAGSAPGVAWGPVYGVVQVVPEPSCISVFGFTLLLLRRRHTESNYG